MTTHWVIGAGGLLGSAVLKLLDSRGESTAQHPVRWNTDSAASDLAEGLRRLVAAASGEWRIYWCAGAGVTNTGRASLDRELSTLEVLLDAVASLGDVTRARGSVIFASSAGGLYGGSVGSPFTETTETVPLGHYGAAKHAAEAALRRVADTTGLRVLTARISNIYGPGQNLAKQQGLISRLCFSALTRSPISVYVSFDTLRDYIFASDCARLMLACGERLGTNPDGSGWHAKILSSGRSVSIGEILGQFRRLNGPQPLVEAGYSAAAALQARDLRLRSAFWTDLGAEPLTPMAVGIHETLQDMRKRWLQPGQFAR